MDQKHCDAAPPPYSESGGYPSGYATQYNQQPGYAPQQPQGGYAPQQAGYAPQQAGCAPQQPGYAPGYNYSHQQTVVVTQPMAHTIAGGQVQDNMTLAIFATICCCWPLGIVAIMRSQECRNALTRGDLVTARTASAEARRYSMFAVAGGIVAFIIGIIIVVVFVVQSSNSYSRYDY